MIELSSQCQGCYENFTIFEPHIPRLLKCKHLLCSECIERELYENTFYCPFCFYELKGNIDEIAPVYLEVIEQQQQQQQVELDNNNNNNNERNSIDNSIDKPRTSSLSLFTQENPNVSISSLKSPDDRGSRVSDPFKFGECKEPNCQNKACASHGYCLNHSTKKKHSVLEESKIANALANTPLNFMSVEGNNLLLRESTHIWPEVVPSELIDRFRHQKRLEMGEAIDLINRAKIIFSREPNILYLDAPVVAVGDIHGQFYDLLNILEVGGEVGKGDHYLFLGDYVDRGSFSCEVILTLLAFKVIYPERVWLIRGNHECASVSGHFGFKEECKMKYGVQVYYSFLLLFQSLPLAAVINTSFGQIFACHGGLSPTIETLDDLSKIYRFVEPEENSSLLDILWSDPINEEETDDMTDIEYEEFISIEWKPNPSRGCSYFYGFQAVNKFLEKNNLLCIIRAHEVQELGFHKHFDPSIISDRLNHSQKMKSSRRITSAILSPHRQFQPDALAQPKSPMVESSLTRKPFSINQEDNSNYLSESSSNDMFECEIDIPSVITVFSAPNYCDRYANKGAILKIDTDLYGFRVLQYDCVEHPKPEITESQMNNHILTVIAICPYMPTSFRDFVRLAIELGPEDNLIEDDEVYEVQISNKSSTTTTTIKSESNESNDNDNNSSILQENEINESKTIFSTPQKTISNNNNNSVNVNINNEKKEIIVETTSKCVLWQPIEDDNINENNNGKLSSIESPEIKKISQSDSLSSVEKENMFSPQEVRKRSSSMKKAGGSTEISVITRTGSHGHSFSAEDIPSNSSPRSPEFSLSSARNRSQSERGFNHPPLRRLSSGARLEGAAKAALELAKLDEENNVISPLKEIQPSSPFEILNETKKPVRRSSAHGNYVSRYKTQILRSSAYTQALASDAINELHPDQLARFMKNIQPGNFKLSDQEKPNISFSALKERFEKKNTEENHYVSVARQELMEYSQSIERGRVNSVSSLREKFDKKARENAERHHAESKKNKFRKRSASLEPSPINQEESKISTEKSSKKDDQKEFRGRRSRRLSVESYFDVEKSPPIRAHSLSPVPPATSTTLSSSSSTTTTTLTTSVSSSRLDKRTTQLPNNTLSKSSTIISNDHDNNNNNISPPRQRAMALIYKPDIMDTNQNQNNSENLPHKISSNQEKQNEKNIISPQPKIRTEYDFLMTYKPDNENKVHFTMRELLALRLLFSLFDRSGCAVIGYEDLVAYGEETGGLAGIRDAAAALEIVDIDGDGKIGLLDFIHFAARLQLLFQRNLMKRVLDELLMNATASNAV